MIRPRAQVPSKVPARTPVAAIARAAAAAAAAILALAGCKPLATASAPVPGGPRHRRSPVPCTPSPPPASPPFIT